MKNNKKFEYAMIDVTSGQITIFNDIDDLKDWINDVTSMSELDEVVFIKGFELQECCDEVRSMVKC